MKRTRMTACQSCGKTLAGPNQRVFCSMRCAALARIRYPERRCLVCGTILSRKTSTTRFCSIKCYEKTSPLRPGLETIRRRWAKNRTLDGQPLCTSCKIVLIPDVTAPHTPFRNHDYVCKSCHSRREEKRRLLVRGEVFMAYGGRCVCCEEWRHEFLSIDHIQGYTLVRGEPRGGYALYSWLRRRGYPQDRFRLLCFNCNQSLATFGYCPHGNVSGPKLRSRGPHREEHRSLS